MEKEKEAEVRAVNWDSEKDIGVMDLAADENENDS